MDRDFKGVFPVDSSQFFDDIIDDPIEPFAPNGDIHGDAMPDADNLEDVTGDALDEYLNAEVMMPCGGAFILALSSNVNEMQMASSLGRGNFSSCWVTRRDHSN